MDASNYQKIRQLFDDYIRMYSSRDDLLTSHFSEDFSGITGSGDYLVKDREAWIAVTRQDFAQVKDPINIELKDLAIQLLAETIAVATSTFTIHLPIEEHVLSQKIVRLVLIFRNESAGWKISHSSISVSFGVAGKDEIYPLKDLEERNLFLEKQVAERTTQLSEANAKLQRTNEELAKEIAGHKQAEEQTVDALNYIQTILSSSPVGIGTYKATGEYVSTNEAIAKIVGGSIGQLKQQNFRDIESWQRFGLLDFAERALTTGIEQRGDFHVVTSFGKEVDINALFVPFMFGGELHLIHTVMDITERKQAEKALTESEERFRSVMEDIPNVAVQGYSLDGTVFFWNRASEILYGYSAKEAVGANLVDLIIPSEMREGIKEAVAQMRESGIPIPASELLLKRKDGSRVPVFSSHALLNSVGRQPELFCLDVDLTELKKADEQLSYSTSLTNASLESTADGILILDRNGVIVRWNQKFIDLWNIPEELLATDVNDQAFKYATSQMAQPEEFLARVMELYEHPEESSQDLLALADGRIFDRYTQPLKIGTEIAGRFWSFRDITEQKQHEEEQLKMEKLESLGLLAGGIAHDFNNILTGVMGNISFAQMFIDSSHKSYKPLVEAEKASRRATELAYQLLTFARGGEPVRKVISLQHIANETVELVLRGSNVKGIVQIPDSIHGIDADEGQMSQVLHNIIINASQAMPGGGTLTVTAQNEALADNNTLNLPPGRYVRLTISDQGCGIPDDVMKRIFDPYFTTKSAGNGLGLASAHSIINRHGGRIGASSAAGEGTTFTLHLPSIGETYAEYQTDSATQSVDDHPGGSILVMDDEEMIRDMSTQMLEYLGYQATTCASGAEAVTLYKAATDSGTPFSAVIMDLTIPGGMGGKDAAEQILAIDAQARLIVSSGYSNDPIMSDYRAYGFTGAVAKPYNINELSQLISDLLSA